MSYQRFHAIIVTGDEGDDGSREEALLGGDSIEEAHTKALELFDSDRLKPGGGDRLVAPASSVLTDVPMVSSLVRSTYNGHRSFFIAPDGSNDGRAASNEADRMRAEFVDYLKTTTLDWAEVQYGDELGFSFVMRSSDRSNQHDPEVLTILMEVVLQVVPNISVNDVHALHLVLLAHLDRRFAELPF